jgi:glutamate synthase (NADPH/NADH) large chain
MSKMGISTYQSYCGAQIFDAVGLSSVRRQYFTGTRRTIEGVGLTRSRPRPCAGTARLFGNDPVYRKHWTWAATTPTAARRGPRLDARAIATCSTRCAATMPRATPSSPKLINEQNERLNDLRGLFEFKFADGAQPVPLDEVEPASEIVKRFATGAMSFGSISREAHSTLALAMNQIGGKSNTGEGGEEPSASSRCPTATRNPERSAIKQVASGRFGVTTEYLVNADMIQIKMAQGAKPGEGGSCPATRSTRQIAKRAPLDAGRRPDLAAAAPRHLLDRGPGAADLRPEERQPEGRYLGQAGLRSGRRHGRCRVSKARADHVTISGYDGGTGASR